MLSKQTDFATIELVTRPSRTCRSNRTGFALCATSSRSMVDLLR
jgi:hypothetical protein